MQDADQLEDIMIERPKRRGLRLTLTVSLMAIAVGGSFALWQQKPEMRATVHAKLAALMSPQGAAGHTGGADGDKIRVKPGEIPDAMDMAKSGLHDVPAPVPTGAKLEQGKSALGGVDALREKYGSILPENIKIPTTLPDLTRIITVADALAAGKEGEGSAGAGGVPKIPEPIDPEPTPQSPLMRYALGEDGISPELADAFRTVVEAQEGSMARMSEAEVARIASEQIGYVPAGVDPAEIRVPGGKLEGPGREIVTGVAEVISGHQILVGDRMIRLQGVRMPGPMEVCTGPGGQDFDCMAWSREGMEHIVGNAELTCAVTLEEHDDGGHIGWCNIGAQGKARDISSIAVGAGILLTVPGETGVSPYDEDAVQAMTRHLGLWAGTIRDRDAPEPALLPIGSADAIKPEFLPLIPFGPLATKEGRDGEMMETGSVKSAPRLTSPDAELKTEKQDPQGSDAPGRENEKI
ncbi:hypothetical protein ACEUZ9_002843 [Paracoccus litorisediminis]|uniref:hypothetical protein n=1 Tax=Paracoccus litorisediminis TaxID=2006130 RepID=UPI003732C126